jgi:hypothetical protein
MMAITEKTKEAAKQNKSGPFIRIRHFKETIKSVERTGEI